MNPSQKRRAVVLDHRRAGTFAAYAVLGVMLAAVSCDDDSPTAPPFTAITLSANAATVPLNGSTTLTATMTELSGLPVADGTTIVFSCCGGDAAGDAVSAGGGLLAAQSTGSALGTIEPRIATTVNGKATVEFTAGARSGLARIVATSGSARAGTLNLPVGSAAVARVVLRATPPSVSASGGTAVMTATVLDSAGNGVPGVLVAFSTTNGTLSDAVVTSSATGDAVTNLALQREAVVTASIGTVAQPASVTVRITPAPTISASVSPQTPLAGQPAQFAFTVAPGAGGAALRDLAVSFGDGQSQTLTGVAGTVLVAHAYTAAGLYTVTGTITDVSGERTVTTLVVAVQPRPPIIVSIDVQNPSALSRNVPVVFAAAISPASELSRVAEYEWDFGDGATVVVNSHSVAHIYRNAGAFLVRVTAVTTDGGRFTAQAAVVVRED